MANGRRSGGLLALALLALACGGSDDAPETAAWVEAPRSGAANQPPRLERVQLEPAEPVAGDEVRAVVRVTDPDHDRVELGYAWSVDGRALPGAGPTLALGNLRRGQEVAVRVTASDGRAQSDPARAVARVGNRSPKLSALRLEPAGEVQRGAALVAVAEGQDADSDPLSFRYAWRVNGRPVPVEGASFPTDDLERGDVIRVRVVASDGEDESPPLESPEARIANAAPRIVSSPPSRGLEGGFRYQLEAQDPDGDRGLRFRLLEGPEGMSLDPVLGEVRWTPGTGQEGVHRVDVAVSDPYGASSAQRFEVTVRGAENALPASPAD